MITSGVIALFACACEEKRADPRSGKQFSLSDKAIMDANLRNVAQGHYNTGRRMLTSTGELTNLAAAVDWFRKAADLGHAESQYFIGTLIIDGRIPEVQTNEASRLIQSAANQNHPGAEFTLGLLYLGNRDLPKNEKEAVRCILKSAAHGFPDAQLAAGNMYSQGHNGVAIDYVEAAKWYQRAADQGNGNAAVNLGGLYGLGHLPKNAEEELRWMRKAAELGNALGQFNLGAMLLRGNKNTHSAEEGLSWIRKAADQGEPTAEGILGGLILAGKGVPKDVMEAYVLLSSSLKHSLQAPGPDETKKLPYTQVAFRAALEKCKAEMEPAQVIEADKRVEQRNRQKERPSQATPRFAPVRGISPTPP